MLLGYLNHQASLCPLVAAEAYRSRHPSGRMEVEMDVAHSL